MSTLKTILYWAAAGFAAVMIIAFTTGAFAQSVKDPSECQSTVEAVSEYTVIKGVVAEVVDEYSAGLVIEHIIAHLGPPPSGVTPTGVTMVENSSKPHILVLILTNPQNTACDSATFYFDVADELRSIAKGGDA